MVDGGYLCYTSISPLHRKKDMVSNYSSSPQSNHSIKTGLGKTSHCKTVVNIFVLRRQGVTPTLSKIFFPDVCFCRRGLGGIPPAWTIVQAHRFFGRGVLPPFYRFDLPAPINREGTSLTNDLKKYQLDSEGQQITAHAPLTFSFHHPSSQ